MKQSLWPLTPVPGSDLEEESMSDRQSVTESQLVEESLVEEVSIDGMCGVY